MLFVGAGLDRATYFGGEFGSHHFKGGIGLEYRASSGLFIGAELRRGGRAARRGGTAPARQSTRGPSASHPVRVQRPDLAFEKLVSDRTGDKGDHDFAGVAGLLVIMTPADLDQLECGYLRLSAE